MQLELWKYTMTTKCMFSSWTCHLHVLILLVHVRSRQGLLYNDKEDDKFSVWSVKSLEMLKETHCVFGSACFWLSWRTCAHCPNQWLVIKPSFTSTDTWGFWLVNQDRPFPCYSNSGACSMDDHTIVWSRAHHWTNCCQFFMRLPCYWSWISSKHCQSSCGSMRR